MSREQMSGYKSDSSSSSSGNDSSRQTCGHITFIPVSFVLLINSAVPAHGGAAAFRTLIMRQRVIFGLDASFVDS